MVQGVQRLRNSLDRIAVGVREELVKQLEKEAGKLVAQMRSIRPAPEIEIDWTWGDTPAGAIMIGRVGRRRYERIAITIYATARTEDFPDGFPAVAAWFEFGTATRVQKTTGRYTGRIIASPYFFPVFRANRRRVRGNISRAVTRGVRKAAK